MLIALLTDFGLDDPYVGVMHAVIHSIAPGMPVVDLTHAVPPQDVTAAAWSLVTSWPFLPRDAVVLAVVDPGVGTARRPVAVDLAGVRFVGPDNGLLTRVALLNPPLAAVELDNPRYWLDPAERNGNGAATIGMSRTFHGRDLFAPVAAYLAHGTPIEALGTPLDPASLVRLPILTPVQHPTYIEAHIITVDHFGNLITDLDGPYVNQLFSAKSVDARLGRHHIRQRAETFGSAPENQPFWYLDSSGHAAIALRNGNAARALNAQTGLAIELRLSEH